ncbi:MAG: AAA family ATPase, partial [bacterium]
PYIGLTLLPGTFDLLTDYTRTFREVNSGLFDERETGGWIRDGHGDLHTQHICMENGIQIFDCIEFNRRFRYSDILCDAAFLTMDLERLGHPELAATYTESYLSAAGQKGTQALYNFYACYRAIVRGKVEGFRFHDPSVSKSEAAQARDNAADFMLLAERYAKTLYPPTLFLMCGLMGSGKSSVAEGLAGKLSLSIFSSDRVRKELAGIDPGEGRKVPFDSDIYSREMTRRTYEKMDENAAGVLRSGGSVVLDATFADPVRRKAAFDTARKTGARPIILYLEADEETLRTRLRKRAKGVSVSDGREEILGDQRKAFIPPDELSDEQRLTLKASGMIEEIVRSAYRRALYTS